MIEFIIIEDDEKYIYKIKRQIENILMNYDFNYKISTELNSNTNFKVYIINYTKRQFLTLNLLKKIRYEQDDWSSMIIVLSKQKFFQELVDLKLMTVDIFDKDELFEENLRRSITISLRNFYSRPKTLKYKYKTVYYSIDLKEILYIEREKDSKKIIIKTKEDSYPYTSTIKAIEEILDKRFIKCSRSYIINLEQVRSYNTKDNIITLKDGTKILEVSRNKRKNIINYLRGIAY